MDIVSWWMRKSFLEEKAVGRFSEPWKQQVQRHNEFGCNTTRTVRSSVLLQHFIYVKKAQNVKALVFCPKK